MPDDQQRTDLTGNWDSGRVGRRAFLGWAGMGAAALVAHASGFSTAKALAAPGFGGEPFSLGVASGDPAPGGVVIWTRLAPEPLAADGRGGMPDRKVPVRWEVASDPSFRGVVRRGTTFATPELAHSVHVEVEGLAPGREYHYRFKAGSETSPAGRALTAPAPAAAPEALAFVSCQNYPDGYYTAFRHISEETSRSSSTPATTSTRAPRRARSGAGTCPTSPSPPRSPRCSALRGRPTRRAARCARCSRCGEDRTAASW